MKDDKMRKLLASALAVATLTTSTLAHESYNPCPEGYKVVDYKVVWGVSTTTNRTNIKQHLADGWVLYGEGLESLEQPMVMCGRKDK